MSILKKMDKNMILVGVAAVAVVITGVLIVAQSGSGFSLPSILGTSNQQIAEKVIKYINDNQLSTTPVTLGGVSEESGLVKVTVKIGAQQVDSYATKDGKILFPQKGYDMSQTKTTAGTNNDTTPSKTAEQIIAAMKKSDKPVVDAFIVSRCPFGLQMQRMIADAIKTVPALADNIKVRYIGSVSGNKITAMHGDAEATENLRQICIRDEQASKYWNYVSCQMKASGTESSCEKSTGIDSAKLNACVSTASRGIAYAKEDFDLANKNSVSGSPTLVVNGATVEEFTSDSQPVFGSGRSSDEMKTIVCDASNSKPGFCSQKLNTAKAATGFSATYEGAASSGSGDAGCDPAQ